MIDKNKQYRTRAGHEVRILMTDGGDWHYPVIAAYKDNEGRWWPIQLTKEGRQAHGNDNWRDLIEVRPRIKREVWVNVYRQDDGYEFATYHDNATDAKSDSGDAIIARAHLILDVEEGDGL